MAKKAYVYDGSAWQDLASSNTDLSNLYTKTQADAKFVDVTGDAMTGNLSSTGKISDALPQPVTKSSTDGSATNVMSVTATAFANISTSTQGTMSVSITTPYAVNCMLTISGWLATGPATSGESLRISTTASGATTWSPGGSAPGGWGSALYMTGYASNNSAEGLSSTTHFVLNAGTTTITMQGYRTATTLTASTISFPHISVTPVSWV